MSGSAIVSEGYGFVFGVRRDGDWVMYRQTIVDSRQMDSMKGTLLSTAVSITGVAAF